MIINDHWTVDLEQLGMKPAGEELSRAILRCAPPFAIGVFGKWGSGKTSLMRYAMARLGGEPLGVTLRSTPSVPMRELPGVIQNQWNDLALGEAPQQFIHEQYEAVSSKSPEDSLVLPIWYSPWQHQTADNPLVPLLHELTAQASAWVQRKELTKKIGVTALESAMDLFANLAESALKLGGLPHGGVGAVPERARSHLANYERDHFQALSSVQRFNLLFEAAIARLLGDDVNDPNDTGQGHQHRRLVIFIDDLDRCEEEQIVRLLESIKLYLRTRYCVFVLGLDDGAVRRAVRRKWSGRTREEAQDYLDKLFQAGIHVPPGKRGKYRDYVRRLLTGWGLETGAEGFGELQDDVLALCERNPRRIKTFVNGLVMGWRASGEDHDSLPDEASVLVHYLRTYHPEVARLLGHDSQLTDTLQKVLLQHMHELQETASPVERFFQQRFRHVFDKEGGETGRSQVDASADELVARIDRYRTDREFVKRLEKQLDSTEGIEAFQTALEA